MFKKNVCRLLLDIYVLRLHESKKCFFGMILSVAYLIVVYSLPLVKIFTKPRLVEAHLICFILM